MASSKYAFTALRATVYLSALIPLTAGLALFIFGMGFENWLSGLTLPLKALEDPTLNNYHRFLGSMWLAYAPLLVLTATDFARYAPLLRIIAAHIALGGLGRMYTIATLGLPDDEMARGLICLAVVLEMVLPALYVGLLQVGLRIKREKAE